jgi:hypothetical protein
VTGRTRARGIFVLRSPARLLVLTPVAALLLTGWSIGGAPNGPGLVPALVAATALAAALAGVHALHLARPVVAAAGLRVHAGAGSGLTADGGPPRQCDPDAPGRCRPRAPGRRTTG